MNGIKVLVRRLGNLTSLEKSYGIIGVPFEGGQKKSGVGTAPQALRSAGLLNELTEHGAKVEDYGDVVGQDVNTTGKAVYDAVQNVLRKGLVPITIGGDHSIALGTLQALHKHNPETVFIWIDAHADINVPKSSPSGNQHGMVVSMLAKELEDHWKNSPHREWTGPPTLSLSKMAYIGLRDVDPYEREILKKFDVKAYHMYDIDRQGSKTILHRALKVLDPDGNRPLHISFDIDSIDPVEAPSTGTPVRGGLTLREAVSLVEYIYATGRLQGFDMVEVNPMIGDEDSKVKTIQSALHVLKAAVGYSRPGVHAVHRRNRIASDNLISAW